MTPIPDHAFRARGIAAYRYRSGGLEPVFESDGSRTTRCARFPRVGDAA